MLTCAGLLEPRGSELRLIKTTLNAIHIQVVLVYLQPFRRNSVLKCALHPKIAKILPKNSFFRGSKSFKVLDADKSKKPVTSAMISNMFVPICNYFHTMQANNGKITSFKEYPSLMPSFKGNLRTHGHEIL